MQIITFWLRKNTIFQFMQRKYSGVLLMISLLNSEPTRRFAFIINYEKQNGTINKYNSEKNKMIGE